MSTIGSVMSSAAMSAPASANALAWLKPWPFAAPVIRTFLPSSPRRVAAMLGSSGRSVGSRGDGGLRRAAVRRGPGVRDRERAAVRVPLGGRARAAVLGGPAHRVDDHVVAGAPAEVAFDAFADGGVVGRGLVQEQAGGRYDHPRRAVAALQPVALPEALLYGGELALGGEPLDREHLAAVDGDGEHGA